MVVDFTILEIREIGLHLHVHPLQRLQGMNATNKCFCKTLGRRWRTICNIMSDDVQCMKECDAL